MPVGGCAFMNGKWTIGIGGRTPSPMIVSEAILVDLWRQGWMTDTFSPVKAVRTPSPANPVKAASAANLRQVASVFSPVKAAGPVNPRQVASMYNPVKVGNVFNLVKAASVFSPVKVRQQRLHRKRRTRETHLDWCF